MKTKFFTLVFLLAAVCWVHRSSAQVNQQLSNLISPTAVNVSLVPKNKSYNLGSLNKPWKKLYLDSAIYAGGTKFISIPVNNSIAIGTEALKAIEQGNANVAVGSYTLSANTTGTSNVAFGTEALYSNTTSSYNTAIGTYSLFNNAANANTAIGYSALFHNTSGYSNVAVGYAALQNNINGYNSVAVGDSALFNQTTNYGNTAFGSKALFSNTSGYDNTAIGNRALFYSTTSEWNTAVGAYALYYNTTGTLNTAMGHGALLNNTTGDENTAIGLQALADNTTGINNTANGEETLRFNTTGGSNTATGWQSLGSNTTASFNTGDGFEAGDNVTDGWYNTFIGSDANCGSGGHLTNSTAIGNLATVTSNNHIVIGNSSITSIGGFANWSNLSDGRVKKNIKQNVPGLLFINLLQPVTYNLDLTAADKIIARPSIKDKNGKTIQPSQIELNARKEKEQIIYTGFIAQDVEQAAKNIHYDFSGIDKPDNSNTLYGLRYGDFVVPLVKAVQELSAQNETLKKENENLEQRVEKLEAMMNVQSASSFNQQQVSNIAIASLSQNSPNPFSNSTIISYSIKQPFSSAKIIITDKNGNALKQINLSNSKAAVTVDASTLSSGAYQYSLYVDGKFIASKQMILSK